MGRDLLPLLTVSRLKLDPERDMHYVVTQSTAHPIEIGFKIISLAWIERGCRMVMLRRPITQSKLIILKPDMKGPRRQ